MNSTLRFPKKTIRDVPVHNKRILMRADFNVPLNEKGEIESDYRILQTLPTLRYLLERKCTVIVVAHLGRPEGRPNKKYSLEVVAEKLKQLLPEYPIEFVGTTIDDKARQACKSAKEGTVTLLENLRFSPGEEANDSDFADALQRTAKADYFVQDGFGVVHRAHASTEAITHLVPSVAGLLLESEVTTLTSVIKQPRHPLVAVIGGAKISDKIGFIEQLLTTADVVLIGGAMANTFLRYQGEPVGKSLIEAGQEAEIKRIYSIAKPGQIILPTDVAVADKIDESAIRRECSVNEVNPNDIILDLGPETIKSFDEHLQNAATVLWNGTLGYAELPQFARSSVQLAKAISDQHHSITSVIGGGDTAEFVLEWRGHHEDRTFTHISTGGGASLELMSGLKLSGVEALISN